MFLTRKDEIQEFLHVQALLVVKSLSNQVQEGRDRLKHVFLALKVLERVGRLQIRNGTPLCLLLRHSAVRDLTGLPTRSERSQTRSLNPISLVAIPSI